METENDSANRTIKHSDSMKPILLKSMFVLLLLSSSWSVFSQDEDFGLYPKGCASPDPRTPQVADFMKYGAVRDNLYKGAVGVDIPVYHYKDEVFDIPVTISYGSSGYKPNLNSGPLGLGWILNTGGVITRKVNGIPDESVGNMYVPVYGYATLWQKKLALGTQYCMLPTDILSSGKESLLVHKITEGKTPYYYETAPDIFSFSFMGQTGSFVLQPDGGIKVFDTSGPVGEYRITAVFQNYTTFTITTGDGYQYIFGNGVVEHDCSNDCAEVTATSFFLTKIIAPNSDEVDFAYVNSPSTLICSPRAYQILWREVKKAAKQESLTTLVREGPLTPIREYTGQVQNSQQLMSITVRNRLKIQFEYEDGPWVKWDPRVYTIYGGLVQSPGGVYYGNDEHGKMVLKRIRVVDLGNQNKDIQTCNLDYKLTDGNSNVTLLKNISISGVGKYSCCYYNENLVFPPINTFAVDWWGYYNGVGTPANFLPEIDNTSKKLLPSYTARNPDPSKAMYGMLSSVVYPTGGRTEFEYEANNYAAKFHSGYLAPLSANILGGGLRIKSVKQYPDSGNRPTIIRSFKYEKNGLSSGVCVGWPDVYKSTWLSDTFTTDVIQIKDGQIGQSVTSGMYIYGIYTSTNMVTSYDESTSSLANNSIEYDFVTELFSDGSAVDHDFYSRKDNIDLAWTPASLLVMEGSPYNDQATPCINLLLGRPQSTIYKDASGRKVYDEL